MRVRTVARECAAVHGTFRCMLHIAASTHGQARLRMLRTVRRGDRHDPRDLLVSCRFEGDFSGAFSEGHAEGLPPGEALKNLVYGTARQNGDGPIEVLGLELCARILSDYTRVSRVRIEVAEQRWARLEVGGKAQGQVFLAGSPERRTTAVTSNGRQIAVVSGIEQLSVMRSSGFAPVRRAHEDPGGIEDGLQRLLVGTLAARWTYSSPDVTFGPYRQGMRTAIVETFGQGTRSVQHTLYAIADVLLTSYGEIVDVSLSFQEHPYRPADLFTAGLENPDEVFLAIDEPVGIVEVTIERER